MINDILNWLLRSSADPEEASLAAKGAVIATIPVLVTLAGLTHLNLDSTTLTNVVDIGFTLFNWALTGIGIVMALVGAVRKVYRTLKGNNSVITGQG